MPRLVLSPYLKCQIDKLSESDGADFPSLTGDFSKMPPVPLVNLWPFFLSGWKYCMFSHADAFCSKRMVLLKWIVVRKRCWATPDVVRIFACWQSRWRYSGQGAMARWDCSPWKPAAFGKDHLNVKLLSNKYNWPALITLGIMCDCWPDALCVFNRSTRLHGYMSKLNTSLYLRFTFNSLLYIMYLLVCSFICLFNLIKCVLSFLNVFICLFIHSFIISFILIYFY